MIDYFVNREAEFKLIDEAFAALLDRKRLLRTPIIELYGVGGIGKTTILKKVADRCTQEQLPCIWANADQSIPSFSQAIVEQAGTLSHQPIQQLASEDWLDQSIHATRMLLSHGPVVMLLDSLDSTDQERLNWVVSLLRSLIEDEKLFVVLASKRALPLDQDRSVVRKLTSLPLGPLDRRSCKLYLDHLAHHIELEIRDLIFEWTRGYPLAMSVMVQAVTSGLDPRKEDDSHEILAEITRQVINQGILANVEPARLSWYHTLLELLSVPRRANLTMMQDLIERFAPDLKRESSLAYFSLQQEINQATSVLSWNMLRVGFAIDTPVRTIFLLKLKMEQPQTYIAVHTFLARENQRLAIQVTGSDRVRYLREYLYHLASMGDTSQLPQQIRETMLLLAGGPPESLSKFSEEFTQFSEEFIQDEELRSALGSYSSIVLSFIHRARAHINRRLAATASEADRLFFLREYFSHLLQDPEAASTTDLAQTLKQDFATLMQNESPELALKLFEELARDASFKTALGKDFDSLAAQIRNNLAGEG